MKFEDYSRIVKFLTDDSRVNIHLLARAKFDEMKKIYSPMIEV